MRFSFANLLRDLFLSFQVKLMLFYFSHAFLRRPAILRLVCLSLSGAAVFISFIQLFKVWGSHSTFFRSFNSVMEASFWIVVILIREGQAVLA